MISMRFILQMGILLLFFVLSNATASAQDDSYHHAVGLRGGPGPIGLTYKWFKFPPAGVLEGIVGINPTNPELGQMLSLTCLYEYHLFISYRVNVYGGGGLTVAFNANDFELAPEAIVGIEYNLETFPLNFSLDFKPAYRLFDKQFVYDEFSLSIRYMLR